MNTFSKMRLFFPLFIIGFLVFPDICLSGEPHDWQATVDFYTDIEDDQHSILGTLYARLSWQPPPGIRISNYRLYHNGSIGQMVSGGSSSGIIRIYRGRFWGSHRHANFEARVEGILSESHSFEIVAYGYKSGSYIAESYSFVWERYPPPLTATEPNPPDGSTVSDLMPSLTWKPGDTSVFHEVYFGDNIDDVLNVDTTDTTGIYQGRYYPAIFTPPEALEFGRTYFWRIDEAERSGTSSFKTYKGDVWSFFVPLQRAYNPYPPDGVQLVEPNIELSWAAGFGGISHTVYFGDNFEDVSNDTGGSAQETTTFNPDNLELDKTYYWRVDEFDNVETHKGDIWSFKTLPLIQITEPNLVGWWKFDKGYGTTVIDWSGHGGHGNIEGNPGWVACGGDYALEFDGVSYVELPAGLVGSDEGSVCLWVKTKQNGRGMIFYGSEGTSGDGYGDENELHISIEVQGKVKFFIEGGHGNDNDVKPMTLNINDDTWHHIAVTWEINDQVNLYVDGNTPVSVNHTGKDFMLVGRLLLGRPNDESDRCYAGLLDDVRLYDFALSADEIAAIFMDSSLLSYSN